MEPDSPLDVRDDAAPAHAAPPFVLHGFWDTRAGARVVSDNAQSKDATLGEMRLQLKTDKGWDRVFIEFTGDGVFDAVDERARLDIRHLRLTWSPVDSLDIRLGRQVLTWGTGDMLFINDLFPKDWVSFFSGRDVEYLKAPSNTVRIGWFNDFMNVEVAYSPRFDEDRHITGKRFSYYSPLHGRTVGRNNKLRTNEPGHWFDNDEIALRLYRRVGNAQLAFYGYSGYWKSPAGMQLLPPRAVFPKLRAYGASLRGMVGSGVGHIEIGYYDSYQDRNGTNPFINNSEFRALLGYEREIARDFTAGVQYYLEYMADYGRYRKTLPFFMPKRDRDRHVFTLRLTKLLMNQNLILSLFAYMSPSDKDAYLRPNVTYKISDIWTVEAGGNVFLGDSKTSFFGQFQNNTNVYAGARLSF
ncbi:MAG TPA: hypothetical protein ENN29_10765 [Candidatus Hydrogenedentes bacterium]|nr:hypothetical protein [Candidatus Hydrogenedentota bacterium]